jgi:hypothetical protein
MVPASPSSKLRRTRLVVDASWFTSDSRRMAASTITLHPEGNSKLTSNVFGSCGPHELRSAHSNRDALIH